MRVLVRVCQPCVLCQATICVDILRRDDETGDETWDREFLDVHECDAMKALKKERSRSTPYAPGR